MTHAAKEKPPLLWAFLDDNLDSDIAVFAVVATPMDGGDSRNIAIKSRQGLEYFGVTLFKDEWCFAPGQAVTVKICFDDNNQEIVKAVAGGKMLDICLSIESAPLFLSLVATSESMSISFPDGEDESWDVDLLFAEPFIRKMMIRLIHGATNDAEVSK